jgi:hypothetical protein
MTTLRKDPSNRAIKITNKLINLKPPLRALIKLLYQLMRVPLVKNITRGTLFA